MLIFAIDDEPLQLETLRRVITEAEPEAQVRAFERPREVLEALGGEGLRPDVVFTDIEMPGMSGLELSAQIKTASPDTVIVFVTGYSEYALDAFRAHVHGYILKPVTVERVREELGTLSVPERQSEPKEGMLQVKCFGNFDVFYRGEPIIFHRKQTKELLAFLIDREGAVCDAEEIIDALWEDVDDISLKKTYLRTLTADLRKTLEEAGIGEVLIRRHRQWAVDRRLIDCDYYRMLDGDIDAVNSFRGEYMRQYSWAEMTAGRLQMQENK